MSRKLIANTQQFSEVASLVDQLGIGAYWDAKRAAGLDWHAPFRRLYQLEAETVIGILREKSGNLQNKDLDQAVRSQNNVKI